MNKGNFLLVMLGVLFVLFIFSPMFIFADYWVTKTYRPITGMTPGADTIDGIIYCMGGYRGVFVSENDAYNPATDTWTTKAPIPIGIYGFAMATVNGKIYIIGGRGDNGHTDSTRIYDSVTDTWTVGASMPTIRENCKAAVVNGKIYVIGGDINYSSGFSNNEMYDPIADTWTIKTPMPTGRFGPAIAVVDDKIYVIGGSMGSSSYTNKNEIYDPTTDIWATGDTISRSKRNCSAGVVDGKIYVIGGWNGSNLSDNDMYNPITDTWTPKTSMNIARNGLATAVVNNKIYAIGGYTGSYTGACEEYNLVYDIGVIAILYPDSGIVGAGYHHISGMVKNFGEISESFKVFTTVFDTTNGWSQIFADTVSVSSLAIQDSIVVDFDSVNFEEDKVYLTKIYVSLPDANITNDTMSVYSSTKHFKVMFVEDAGGYGAPYHPDSTWFIPLQNLLGDSIYWYGLTNDEYENGPSLAAMQHADLVIWNCYDYYDAASFTDYDTTNISDYIAGGGKIWLIGQDIVYSNTNKGKDKTRSRGTRTVWSWLTNNFGVDSVYEDYLEEYTMNIQGQNEILGNIIPVVSDFDQGYDGYLYPDKLYPGANAHLVLADPDSNFCIGVISNDSTTSFWAADGRGANLSPGGDWETLIKDMLHIFNIPILGIKTNISDIEQNRKVNLIVKRTLGSDIYFTYKGIRNANISVNDISGRVIRKYKNVKPDSKLIFKGKSISSGVYFIKVNGKKIITKVSIIK